MFKNLRSAKDLPSSAILLAAIVLASCGAGDGAAAPAAEAAADAAIDTAGAASAPEASAPPAFIGSWGRDLAQCAIAQELEGAPMILRADGFDQHEAHCDYDSVDQTGPAQWRVIGHCSVEGDEQPIDENLAIVDGNLEQWSGDREEGFWTLVRCPE